jgi:hypothetical protein
MLPQVQKRGSESYHRRYRRRDDFTYCVKLDDVHSVDFDGNTFGWLDLRRKEELSEAGVEERDTGLKQILSVSSITLGIQFVD